MLVVVSIIALLIAVLLPSLSAAREQARATVCLSNLKQQGTAMSAYAADHAQRLPRAGSFRFSLMEGLYYSGVDTEERHNWSRVNIGWLYPKYVGETTLMFYCPGNRFIDSEDEKGTKRFLQCYRNQKVGDPDYLDAHNFPLSPQSAYAYAIPVAPGTSPRNEGKNVYPEAVVRSFDGMETPYWQYLNDLTEPDPSFLGPMPPTARGRHNVHALVSDGYFAQDYIGYHLKGYNVLYSDFHARRVVDPGGKIRKANLNAVRYHANSMNYTDSARKVFQVWDYFSKNN